MKKPKLGFRNLSIPEKIQKSREVVTHLTGNVNFTTPNPTLAVVTTAINALETAHELAADGGKALKSAMRAKEKVLVDLMVQLQEYVANASGGDEQKILSAGLGVKTTTSRQKKGVSVIAGLNPGEIICTAASPVKGIKAIHEFQSCIDPIPVDVKVDSVNQWVNAEISSKATVTISNLPLGIKIWIRHRLILSKGQKEPWVVIGSAIVPK
jgi:hypothetical protein